MNIDDILKGQPPEIRKPKNGAKLYKVMRSEHFFSSVKDKFFNFSRVDTYDDFSDSKQPILEEIKNEAIIFERCPDENLAKYINNLRHVTYACCFSTEMNDYLWDTYSGGDPNAICIVFDYTKLIEELFSVFYASDTKILLNDKIIQNNQGDLYFFHLTFGLVDYIDPDKYFKSSQSNIRKYCFLKNHHKYSKDKEFRITLGPLYDKVEHIDFSEKLQLEFNFQRANSKKIIEGLCLRSFPNEDFISKLNNALSTTHIKY